MLFPNLSVSDWYKRPVVSSFTMVGKLRKALPANLGNHALFSDAMTGDAQENGIVRIIAEIGSLNPRLDMMNLHLGSRFAAVLTCAHITRPYTSKEFLVLGRFPVTRTSATTPVRVVCPCESPAPISAYLGSCLVRGWAALDPLKFTANGVANFLSRFGGYLPAYAIFISLCGLAHLRSGFGSFGGIAVRVIFVHLTALRAAKDAWFILVNHAFESFTAVLTDKNPCTHVCLPGIVQ